MSARVCRGLASCFGSGVVTFLLSISFFPSLGYAGAALAAVIGAFIGYIGVDIREFLRVIPEALRDAARVVNRVFGMSTAFIQKYRPLLITQVVISGLVYYGVYRWSITRGDIQASTFLHFLEVIGMVWTVLWAFPFVGQQTWLLLTLHQTDEEMQQKWCTRLQFDSARQLREFLCFKKGDAFGKLSWKDVVQMYFDAAGQSVLVVIALGRGFFYYSVRIVSWLFSFPFVFAWKLFKKIHSEIRLMCMVDGPMGGIFGVALCWYFTGADPLTLPQGMLLAWAGVAGLFSLGLGYLNYKVIAQGWLKTMAQS